MGVPDPSVEEVEAQWVCISSQLRQFTPFLSEGDRSQYYRLFELIRLEAIHKRPQLWEGLVTYVGNLFQFRRWSWNGIYALVEGQLELTVAKGPPVCEHLQRYGGVGSSGACFDSILLNRSLVIPDVGSWPGYVSCDGRSGLVTRGSLVVPVRSPLGSPVGVWDLDAGADVGFQDGILMEALISFASFATRGVLPVADRHQS